MTAIAAFDFDGTLTDGGSVLAFLSALCGTPKVAVASLGMAPRLARAALVGGAVADRTKEELFGRTLAGVPHDRVTEVSVRFAADHLERHQRSEVRRRLTWHKERGDRIVIVSASPECYVAEAGALLGADGVVATRLAVDGNGRLTGRYDGSNCRGEEKIRRLRRWMEDEGLPSAYLWAYGNSRGDLRMLRAADVGINAGRLGALGKLRGFPGLDRATPPGPPGGSDT